ncbi:hypothetical protein KA005_09330 [bacterium]|nr:hypothetical protein [bacterium]
MDYYVDCPGCGCETRLSMDEAEDFEEEVKCEYCECVFRAIVSVEVEYTTRTMTLNDPLEAAILRGEIKRSQDELKKLLPKMKDDTATERERCRWRNILRRLKEIEEEEQIC